MSTSGSIGGDDARGHVLLALARGALEEALGLKGTPRGQVAPWLEEEAATFVTLKIGGRLRGCIGTLFPRRSLLEDVRHNAVAAAFDDPRFPSLAAEELPRLEIEVSLLSSLQALEFADEEDLLSQLRPGVDGVVMEFGPHRGTFLPQVWGQLPEPRSFFAHLKKKAGLETDFWNDDVRVSTYTVTKWREGRTATS